MRRPVLIVGGGIGGLALAGMLQHRGRECLVIEQRDSLEQKGAGLALWPNATRILRELGVLEALQEQSNRLKNAVFRQWHGAYLRSLPIHKLEAHFGAPTLISARADLHRTLFAKLQESNCVHFGSRVQEIEEDTDGVKLHLTDGRTFEGDCVVGADGLHSIVRQSLYPDIAMRYAGRTSWRGIVHMGESLQTLMPSGDMYETWGPGQRVGLFQISPERAYWYVLVNASKGQFDGGVEKTTLLQLTEHWASPIPEILQATPDESILHTDIHDLPPLPSWYRGRIGVLGDAAHAMTPDLGQGACQAILDASALAKELCEAGSPTTAFAQFEAQRRKTATRIQRGSRLSGWVRQWRHPVMRWLRDTGAKIVPNALMLGMLRRVISMP